MTAAVRLLSLAAAPTFAAMALVTAVLESGAAPALCTAGHGTWAPTGMAPMYLLMGAFHLAPWLRWLDRDI
ncbi:MAG: hypothetical protein AB7P02_20475 [Alphaproteobacteria bacterium]